MLRHRKYDTYEQYLSHQGKKMKGMQDARKANWKFGWRIYRRRLEPLAKYISGGKVLCLGARFGEEVKAFVDLGFKKSIGIDVAPGPFGKYVRKGDFHNIPFDDESFDCVYSNSMDHALKINKVANEIYRVLRPKGTMLLEFGHTNKQKDQIRDGVKNELKYESLLWDDIEDIKKVFLRKFRFKKQFLNPKNRKFICTVWTKKPQRTSSSK